MQLYYLALLSFNLFLRKELKLFKLSYLKCQNNTKDNDYEDEDEDDNDDDEDDEDDRVFREDVNGVNHTFLDKV